MCSGSGTFSFAIGTAMPTAYLVAAALASLVAALYVVLRVAIRRVRRPGAEDRSLLPPLLVIRPVRGHDPGLEANVRAALAQRYRGPVETLFVLDDSADPALPILQRVLGEDPGAAARIVFSGPPRGRRTGKLHAMIHGMEAARSSAPLICFADSDSRPPPGLIRELASRLLSADDIGATFAPVACSHPPETPGDVAYALLLDGLYGPQAALTMAYRGTLPFVMGQTMVVRRSALVAAGGLEGSEGQLVDDMHIGARIAAAGYRNVLIGTTLPIVQRGLPWSDFLALARRWLIYGRTGIPFWPFNVPVLVATAVYFTGLVGSLVAVAYGALPSAAALLAAALTVPVALHQLSRLQGGAPVPARLSWAVLGALTLLPALQLSARFAQTVAWRGRVYALDASGTLRGADDDEAGSSRRAVPSFPGPLRSDA